MDLNKIREIKARNLAAMEAENKAKAEAKAEEERRQAYLDSPEAKAASARMLAEAAGLVLKLVEDNPRISQRKINQIRAIEVRNRILGAK